MTVPAIDAVDPELARRLRDRARRPGLLGPGPGAAILARCRRMLPVLPLAEAALAGADPTAPWDAAAPPIVYASPVPAAGPADPGVPTIDSADLVFPDGPIPAGEGPPLPVVAALPVDPPSPDVRPGPPGSTTPARTTPTRTTPTRTTPAPATPAPIDRAAPVVPVGGVPAVPAVPAVPNVPVPTPSAPPTDLRVPPSSPAPAAGSPESADPGGPPGSRPPLRGGPPPAPMLGTDPSTLDAPPRGAAAAHRALVVAPLSRGARTVSTLVTAPAVPGHRALAAGPPADGPAAASAGSGERLTAPPVVAPRTAPPPGPANPAAPVITAPPVAATPVAAAHRDRHPGLARPFAPLPLLDLPAAAAPVDRSPTVDPARATPPPGPAAADRAQPERASRRPGPGRPALDLDRLAGAVHRRVVRQLAIEAERRGVPPRGIPRGGGR